MVVTGRAGRRSPMARRAPTRPSSRPPRCTPTCGAPPRTRACSVDFAYPLPEDDTPSDPFEGGAATQCTRDSITAALSGEGYVCDPLVNTPIVGSAPVLSSDQRTVYVTSSTTVYALDADTLETKWTVPVPGGIVGPVTVAGGTIYVATGDSLVATPASGCGSATCPPTWSTSLGGGAVSRPTVAGGVAYVVSRPADGSGGDVLQAFDAGCSSGCAPLRSLRTGLVVTGSPVVTTRSRVYLTGTAVGIDPSVDEGRLVAYGPELSHRRGHPAGRSRTALRAAGGGASSPSPPARSGASPSSDRAGCSPRGRPQCRPVDVAVPAGPAARSRQVIGRMIDWSPRSPVVSRTWPARRPQTARRPCRRSRCRARRVFAALVGRYRPGAQRSRRGVRPRPRCSPPAAWPGPPGPSSRGSSPTARPERDGTPGRAARPGVERLEETGLTGSGIHRPDRPSASGRARYVGRRAGTAGSVSNHRSADGGFSRWADPVVHPSRACRRCVEQPGHRRTRRLR